MASLRAPHNGPWHLLLLLLYIKRLWGWRVKVTSASSSISLAWWTQLFPVLCSGAFLEVRTWPAGAMPQKYMNLSESSLHSFILLLLAQISPSQGSGIPKPASNRNCLLGFSKPGYMSHLRSFSVLPKIASFFIVFVANSSAQLSGSYLMR